MDQEAIMGLRTEDGRLALALAFVDEGLDKLRGLELDFPNRGLGVELPDTRTHVEHVHPARVHARALCGHLAHLQQRGAMAVPGTGGDAEEATGVVRGRGRDVVEARGDAAVEADELGEVGEEAGGFVRLDLAVLDRRAA